MMEITIRLTDENYIKMFKAYEKESIEKEINQFWIPDVMIPIRDNYNKGLRIVHISLSDLEHYSISSITDLKDIETL